MDLQKLFSLNARDSMYKFSLHFKKVILKTEYKRRITNWLR